MAEPLLVIDPALVVLDLDGTLARLDIDWEAVRGAIRDLLHARGLMVDGGVGATLAALDAAGECEAANACRAIVAGAERAAAHAAPLNRALLDWLDDVLPEAQLAVLTLNDRGAALASLAALVRARRLDPDDVLGREEAPAKPDPEGLLTLLRRHRVHPDRAVLIGDRERDHACGRSCGVATIDVGAIGIAWAPPPALGGPVAACP